MRYIELLQESPGLFFIVLILSLIVTLFVYGAFPIIFAKLRKTPITQKKYTLLCFGINFIGLIFFIVLNGSASGGPYLLWTWVFSSFGTKTLKQRELLLNASPTEAAPPAKKESIRFCRKCGTELGDDSRFCRKCGTEVKEEEEQ